jgi:poly(hydroxyalkanoate) granule-associated protein
MAKTTVKKVSRPAAAGGLQQDLTTAGRNLMLAGMGAVATVADEGNSLWDTLVEKGRARRSEGRLLPALPKVPQLEQLVDDAREQVEKLGDRAQKLVQDRTASLLHRFGVPSRGEIQTLIRRVEQLSAKVEALAGQHTVVN